MEVPGMLRAAFARYAAGGPMWVTHERVHRWIALGLQKVSAWLLQPKEQQCSG